MATTDQLEIARQFIDQLDREICLKQSQNGYALKRPGSTFIGYVRYNIARENAGKYVVYANNPFDDPESRFENEQIGAPHRGWRLFVAPKDTELIRYALSVLRSAYDAR